MGAEGGRGLLDVLHVANVREYAVEYRQRAAGVDGNRQAALVHHGQEPRRLERGGLAAHVRPRYHQAGPSGAHVNVDGHGLAAKQGMTRLDQADGVAGVHVQGRRLAAGPRIWRAP